MTTATEPVEDSTDEPAAPHQPAAPPWLWLWMGFFLTHVGQYWSEWQGNIEQFREVLASNQRLVQAGMPRSLFDTVILIPPAILDFLPTLGLMASVAVAFLPQLRARYLERRFRLRPPAEDEASLIEVRAFVRRHDPSLQMTANLARANQIAFVYPASPRRAKLAVFGGLLKLWHSDRPAAEAVLLHEIAHHRRGDALVMGIGSLFQGLIRWMPLAWLALYVLPVLTMDVVQACRSVTETDALDSQFRQLMSSLGTTAPATHPFLHQIKSFFAITLPGIVFPLLGGLAGHINPLVLPIAALWAAELSADRVAAQSQKTPDHARRVFSRIQQESSRWRRLLFCVYHPPLALRRCVIGMKGKAGLVVLLSIYPLGLLVKFGLYHLYANGAYLSTLELAKAVGQLVPNTLRFMSSLPIGLVAMGLLLVLWPLVSERWEKLVTGVSERKSCSGYSVYAGMGGLLLSLAAIAWAATR